MAWTPLAVHARTLLIEERAAVGLQALAALGAGPGWLLQRHVLSTVLGPVLTHALVRLPGVALSLAALGLLGLGAPPPSPKWGLLLADGLDDVERAPWAVAVPGLGLLWPGAVSAGGSGLGLHLAPGRRRYGPAPRCPTDTRPAPG